MAGQTLYLAVLHAFAGYGLSALADTEAKAERLVRARFFKERQATHLKNTEFETMTWKSAKEYFGFSSTSVEVGKSYFNEVPGE